MTKTVYINGRYTVKKHYDRAVQRYFYNVFRDNYLIMTEMKQKDAIRKCKEWIEINGRF